MKSLLRRLVLIPTCFSALTVCAQWPTADKEIGVTGIYNKTGFISNIDPLKFSRRGPGFGVEFNYLNNMNDHQGWLIGLGFQTHSWQDFSTIFNVSDTSESEGDASYATIAVPLVSKWQIGNGRYFTLEAGAELGYVVSSKWKITSSDFENENNASMNDLFNPFRINVITGFGSKFPLNGGFNLYFKLRHLLSINSLLKELGPVNGANRVTTIQLSLGITKDIGSLY